MTTSPGKLIKWNKLLALLHAAQALLVVWLASDFSLPVTTSFQVYDPATEQLNLATGHLFDMRIAWLVAGFFTLSALAHFILGWTATRWYTAKLEQGISYIRWFEYALSASVMIWAIAQLAGVEDLSTLIALFVLTAIMNLCGLAMEVYNRDGKKPNWTAYWIGVLAGALPWVVIGIYFWGAESFGAGGIPTFVYYIYASIFVFFNLFALNMVLQYKQIGRWDDYLYGERAYMILSLLAKSALAWQIYAGTLRPV